MPDRAVSRSLHPHAYAYSVKIETGAKVEQRGTSMDSLKRAFRSIFKRGKKSKEDRGLQTSPAAAARPQQTPKKPTANSQAQAPAAPPKDAARAAAEPNRTGQLPPTHPLATGQHDSARGVLQRDHTAKPGVAAGGGTLDSHDGLEERVSREEPGQPTSLIPRQRSDSEAVSTISKDEPPAPPPKVDGAADAVVASPPEAAVAASAATESQPPHVQSTGEPLVTPEPPTEPAKENAKPNGTTPTHINKVPTRLDTAIPTKLDTAAAQEPISPIEDKMLADEVHEPPPINPVKAAPGMSATSGPLEDFPEGGDYRE